jgi:enterochelin esterase-like enzyme
MRARRLSSLVLGSSLALCASPLLAQTTAQTAAATCVKPWFTPMPPPVRSVEILSDGRVTFRLCAPQAHEVLATSADAGDVIPMGFPVGTPQGLVLTRDETGLWTGTTAKPFKPGPYRYAFRVDGLRTADPYAESVSRTRYGVEAVLEVPGSQFQSWDASLPHGTVATVDYWSASLKARRRAHVYTPPFYEKGGAQRYPVLYLVHGAGDNDDSWTSIGHAQNILDRLIAEGKVKPMIVVMPDGHTPDFARSIDFHAHDFGDDLTKDLIPLVDKSYRTIPAADSRAMAGLSMGGSHTLREGLTRPDLFHWIGVFSMGVGVGSQIGVDPKRVEEYRTENDAALKQAARDMHLVYFAMGREDFLYGAVKPTRDLFDAFGIRHIYHETDGGHTWINWRDYLADFAPRLFQTVPPAKAPVKGGKR